MMLCVCCVCKYVQFRMFSGHISGGHYPVGCDLVKCCDNTCCFRSVVLEVLF